MDILIWLYYQKFKKKSCKIENINKQKFFDLFSVIHSQKHSICKTINTICKNKNTKHTKSHFKQIEIAKKTSPVEE